MDRPDPRHDKAAPARGEHPAANVELTADDLREIEDAQIEAAGAGYTESAQRMIDR